MMLQKRRRAAYEDLKFYQDICKLRRLIYKITKRFRRTHLRLVSQMRDAARSAKQNIREGYKKGTLGEFIHSIKISQGSLEELQDLTKLLQSAGYMSTRYLESLYKMEREGTWKVPGSSRRKKRNLIRVKQAE